MMDVPYVSPGPNRKNDFFLSIRKLLDISVEDVWSQDGYGNLAAAHSLLCFWVVRELGTSMTSIAHRFRIPTGAMGKSVKRGAEIGKRQGHQLT